MLIVIVWLQSLLGHIARFHSTVIFVAGHMILRILQCRELVSKMKLGILTFHFADNYGAVLQAYALQTYLETLGHEVSIINYQPGYITNGGHLRFPRSKRDIYADARVIFIKIALFRAALTGKTRKAAFAAFRTRHLKTNRREYTTLAQLRAEPPACDAYICGSDQIWNPPARAGVDAAYYLDFGTKTCRRISYAASFGRAAIEEDYKKDIGRLLAGLDAVSVREKSGLELVKNLAGRDASWMPDPSLLLNDYQPVITKPEDEDFVFSYCLRGNNFIADVQKFVAKALHTQLILPYNSQQRWSSNGKVVYLGPSEWVGRIRYARTVVTNSLHGTIFSILFRKPFIAIPLAGRKQNLNERVMSLLTRLGLKDRLLCGTRQADIRRLMDTRVDWEDVYGRLRVWQDEARDYFINTLR